MTPEQLAQIAYEAWRDAKWWGEKAANSEQEWHGLNNATRAAWLAAAQAVKANVLSGFTHVGEGESSV